MNLNAFFKYVGSIKTPFSLGKNLSSASKRPSVGPRTAMLPGTALDIDVLRAQIRQDRGGPLLSILQEAALTVPDVLAASRSSVPSRLLAETVSQNFKGGKRRDLPPTPAEGRGLIFTALSCTLDFDREKKRYLDRLFQIYDHTSAFLAPTTKEETLVLTEAYQAVGWYERAQLVLSDGFGRFGFDGDREMFCLQSNNILYMRRDNKLEPREASVIRRESIGEVFGQLEHPEFGHKLNIETIFCEAESDVSSVKKVPRASVILTVLNGEKTLGYALKSIRKQTWRNLEVIIVDDGSTDSTPSIIERARAADRRIKVITNPTPRGAFASRNIGLKHISGDAVTCHDADDWSHPSKIERQMRLLFENPKTIACTSSWIRTTFELEFTRKSRYSRYIQKNPSSVLFKVKALKRLGNWDEVTLGADTEFEERLKTVYGRRNVKHLNEVLSLGLDHATSLSKETVWRGWLSPDLAAYHRAFNHWHSLLIDQKKHSLLPVKVDRGSPNRRAFPAPAGMLGVKRQTQFDVVMLSDFRLFGGSVLSCVEEIKAQKRAGLTTAIHQINTVTEDITGREKLNREVDQLIHDGACTLIGSDWEVEAGLCSMRFPPIFNFPPSGMPKINAKTYTLAVNTAPIEANGEGRMYHIDRVVENMTRTFGHPATWYPIGPRIREYIKDEVPPSILAPNDWVNIVDVDSWLIRRTNFVSDRPVIGRHSRDDKFKWPTDAKTIKEVYFNDPTWKVSILGGAKVVERLAGALPRNVNVTPFNGLPVKLFLSRLDFFVYYDDPMRVEAFGRVFIEAIAAGCCVILPRYYEPVFGDACLYADPHEVKDLVNSLYADKPRFLAQITKAQAIARRKWSYQTHIQRIRNLIDS